jgi:hypothetical protein
MEENSSKNGIKKIITKPINLVSKKDTHLTSRFFINSFRFTVKANSPHPYYDGSVDARTPVAARRLRRLLRKLRK